jgi:hypothetical protein
MLKGEVIPPKGNVFADLGDVRPVTLLCDTGTSVLDAKLAKYPNYTHQRCFSANLAQACAKHNPSFPQPVKALAVRWN